MPLTPSAHVDPFCRDRLPAMPTWPELRFDLPELRYPDRLNCAAVLLDGTTARLGADRPCLLTPDGCWTYGQLLERANRVARLLTTAHGLVPGRRVLLRGPNTPWLVACWFAVVKAGGVAVTTMPMLRRAEIDQIVAATEPSLLLCDHRYLDEVPVSPTTTVLGFGGDDPSDLTVAAASMPGDFDNVETAADDVALLAPTSGTTGRPKVTMHFHRDVLANADTFSAHIVGPRPDDVFTGSPPLAFTFGLGSLVVFPLRVGAASLLLERATPAELADAVAMRGATVLFTAPTAYRAILREGRAGALASLRRCVSAGEHLPAAVSDRFFAETGLRIVDGIGGTEMLHIFISAADGDIRPGSTGRVVPGYEAEIQDDDGRPVADGTPGALAVKGPTGCRYLADDRQTRYVRNGWNITGDVFVRDGDGYFWYQGRSDDMIVSSGYNIAAPEVEAAIDGHPDVAQCAVVGRPDGERGTVVHALVVLEPGVAGDDDEVRAIQDHVKATIAPYKYPRSIEFVADLPRTGTGKLQRFRLRAGDPTEASCA